MTRKSGPRNVNSETLSFGQAVFLQLCAAGRPGFAEGAFSKAWSDNSWVQEDHPIKELCEAVARGATYLHPLLLWVGGASFPATFCKNGLFSCFMLLAYSIYTEGILKLWRSYTEEVPGFPFLVLLFLIQ
jgi:hypothetical protein